MDVIGVFKSKEYELATLQSGMRIRKANRYILGIQQNLASPKRQHLIARFGLGIGRAAQMCCTVQARCSEGNAFSKFQNQSYLFLGKRLVILSTERLVGQAPRQPGQVRKEAAVTNSVRVVPIFP